MRSLIWSLGFFGLFILTSAKVTQWHFQGQVRCEHEKSLEGKRKILFKVVQEHALYSNLVCLNHTIDSSGMFNVSCNATANDNAVIYFYHACDGICRLYYNDRSDKIRIDWNDIVLGKYDIRRDDAECSAEIYEE
ncbi:unnamed protein product [Bursaphelenchus xylophilus]|uniref:(pine wood nematode) hypothetical protein n=1 Tax=Bursaphelenchus xylophilus TaxID=6326 RepID=A0A1I7RVS1_BURXY|nr:unnamed protein product [Bursaphelenchus xylophilus]CAD5208585.1 unnamed protein product [Bursaphelenchus xylophilus]CAG9082066.1 unnamed protein product [Bursaphelenchus xylophilus]CAG9082086.1 unnamed protein product [Bursaphelenchus xylophilus]